MNEDTICWILNKLQISEATPAHVVKIAERIEKLVEEVDKLKEENQRLREMLSAFIIRP